MVKPAPDLQRNLVSVVLTIVGLIQGLVFNEIAEKIAPYFIEKFSDESVTSILVLILLFATFLRIFQTFVVGAIGYEKAAFDPFELFVLLLLLFVVGTVEYILIGLFGTSQRAYLFGLMSALCWVGATAYGWLCYRAQAFSVDNPPYATRDRKLQAINTGFSFIEGAFCAWLAIEPDGTMTNTLIVIVTLLLLLNIYISIRMTFYLPDQKRGKSGIYDHALSVLGPPCLWQKRIRHACELLGLYVAPPATILLGIIAFRFRMELLVLVGAAIIGIALLDQPKLRTPDRDAYLFSAGANLAVILATAALFLLFRAHSAPGGAAQPVSTPFLAFYILISAPIQEFVFRYRLKMIFGSRAPVPYVLASAILYSWIHVIYFDPLILIGAFILGLIWAAIFWRTNDLIGVSVSHAAIGIMAFWSGAA